MAELYNCQKLNKDISRTLKENKEQRSRKCLDYISKLVNALSSVVCYLYGLACIMTFNTKPALKLESSCSDQLLFRIKRDRYFRTKIEVLYPVNFQLASLLSDNDVLEIKGNMMPSSMINGPSNNNTSSNNVEPTVRGSPQEFPQQINQKNKTENSTEAAATNNSAKDKNTWSKIKDILAVQTEKYMGNTFQTFEIPNMESIQKLLQDQELFTQTQEEGSKSFISYTALSANDEKETEIEELENNIYKNFRNTTKASAVHTTNMEFYQESSLQNLKSEPKQNTEEFREKTVSSNLISKGKESLTELKSRNARDLTTDADQPNAQCAVEQNIVHKMYFSCIPNLKKDHIYSKDKTSKTPSLDDNFVLSKTTASQHSKSRKMRRSNFVRDIDNCFLECDRKKIKTCKIKRENNTSRSLITFKYVQESYEIREGVEGFFSWKNYLSRSRVHWPSMHPLLPHKERFLN